MHSATQICVKPSSEFYPYFDTIAALCNNLRNAALYRTRQVLTMVEKPFDKLTANELEVYNEIAYALPAMGDKFKMPVKGKQFLSVDFLEALMRATNNPDFMAKGLPKQTAQQVLKEVAKNMKGFYAGVRKYKKDHASFTGKVKLPRYSEKGGRHTIAFTNQDCVIYEIKGKPGFHEVKFPEIKKRLYIADMPLRGRLKQITVKPNHGNYIVSLVFDDEKETPVTRPPHRMVGIDLGVDNTAAITNNLGLPCLLFKGGVLKSINQLYNKKMAAIQSEQTKDTDKKFVMTKKTHSLCVWRNNRIEDTINKIGSSIVAWCCDNDVDTIVIGHNTHWKQNANMGKKNNQTVVQLPLYKLILNITYRAERCGIRVINREESYTSKASFLDNDAIPTYGKNDEEYKFSGKRVKRGLYKAADGTVINADLNGSANILRKEFPDVFASHQPDFGNVIVIRHPDLENAKNNHKKQLAEPKAISKSKTKRLKAKGKM